MAGSKALTHLQTGQKAHKRLGEWYHKHIQQEATPAQEDEYAEVTGLIRSILEKAAPSLAIEDFGSDVLDAVFGVREGDPRKIPMLGVSADDDLSVLCFRLMFLSFSPAI
jgi:hypothetical protein